jgi:hypothetical protein
MASLSFGVGRGGPLTVKKFLTKYYTKLRTWADALDKGPKHTKIGMWFGTWNTSRLCRAGLLMARYSGNVGEYTVFCVKGNENRELGTNVFCT